MEIFDRDGNFLGEFIEKQKDDVADSFESSWGWGLLCLLWKFLPAVIIVTILWFIFKAIFLLIKLCLKIIWWIIRLPFCWFFYREFPEF